MNSLATLSADAAAQFKKFKIKRNPENCALILKINRSNNSIDVEEELDNTPLLDLQDYLPTTEPRFIVYSYKFETRDGRITYPLVLIYSSPTGINPQFSMIYTSCLASLQSSLPGVQRNYTVKDVEDLTDEWMIENLKKA
ncbi:Glia maturation factor beta, putative [Entamoeba dispar SAW760]|uniref:Glia maturation factor beta, putative n=1 Tax=Entamoeba dispar (strain ATCC PRA-260 / SAW760) TaxID=370354 RepID=B0EDB1_ENTDS|nr:Glia maturation factor beta, putative [Entamoeba dispar SAW760]EDR27528.1 Glia maturation factor beta, putative [Entamoeba dispar SAW760]|eukprot:EDR27528.1 Glia maturation factor beta, putative [Entamoeba dispar SAW760]